MTTNLWVEQVRCCRQIKKQINNLMFQFNELLNQADILYIQIQNDLEHRIPRTGKC